jgi:hypothetical protein
VTFDIMMALVSLVHRNTSYTTRSGSIRPERPLFSGYNAARSSLEVRMTASLLDLVCDLEAR